MFARSLLAGASLALLLAAPNAHAEYPSKPITLVVNFTAGGPLDIEARLIAQHASRLLGQSVIVENRPGAAGNIGAGAVARAKPDGYTLLITTDTLATVNPHVYPSMPFDPIKDFRPVALAGAFGQVMVVRPELEVPTLDALLAQAKANPMAYATAGSASPGHLTFEMFNQAADLDLTHIPYRGNAQATNDLLGGQVETGFLAIPGVLPHIQQGKLVALAVSGQERDPALPDVPAVAENQQAGLRDFDARFAYLVLMPAETPDAIVDRWEEVLGEVFQDEAFQERLASLGIRPPFAGRQAATDWVDTQSEKWAKVVQQANITVE
ncbi:MAG: tripartite tricarboxylate transporter substrate binding protein [Pigmentiphaga sp.]|nr:tripartite tricarboxylate transporter substrate binding protein [Pigmentiphaga sp.]